MWEKKKCPLILITYHHYIIIMNNCSEKETPLARLSHHFQLLICYQSMGIGHYEDDHEDKEQVED